MRVRFFAYIRNFTKCNEADVPYRETVGDLALSLCDLYGNELRQKVFPCWVEGEQIKEFGPEIIFLINGRHVSHLGGIAAPLNPDDRVDIFPVVAGG